ncbi:MAG: hypothetical protein JKZ03_04885, partial [Flavobacteriaceae bacterium]|nr:hypothetical protein [Flavobacteriaceae bacterium]
IQIEQKEDIEYPDNPEIGFRSGNYKNNIFKEVYLTRKSDFIFDFEIQLSDHNSITMENLDLSEWIPTIPDHLKQDEYLSYLSVVYQEWNRNQVAFNQNHFTSTNQDITRVDIARNCLHSGLWEIILFTKENNQELRIGHGWFNFPLSEYENLFQKKNNIPFDKYRPYLTEWVETDKQTVDRTKLRKIVREIPVQFQDLSNHPYPLVGEQKVKFKEIISPTAFRSMKELQSDSTSFASYSPPGMYDKSVPRKTELGRFYTINSIEVNELFNESGNKNLSEIKLRFLDKEKERETNFFLGGIDLPEIPFLAEDEVDKGWQNSMGFGNHTFYETYEHHKSVRTKTNLYYSYLSNANDEWLDNHKVGIDGALLHFDDKSKNKLHIWLLSYERHAFVGHYLVEFDETVNATLSE